MNSSEPCNRARHHLYAFRAQTMWRIETAERTPLNGKKPFVLHLSTALYKHNRQNERQTKIIHKYLTNIISDFLFSKMALTISSFG